MPEPPITYEYNGYCRPIEGIGSILEQKVDRCELEESKNNYNVLVEQLKTTNYFVGRLQDTVDRLEKIIKIMLMEQGSNCEIEESEL